jgi:hypothetical protein
VNGIQLAITVPIAAEMIFEWPALEQSLFEGTGNTGAR